MRDRLRTIDARVLPRGWTDFARQAVLFLTAFLVYDVVRGLVDNGNLYKPFGDATRIIDLERVLHVFVEPSIQAWTANTRWLMDIADWSYLNTHFFVTFAALAFIYFRRNDSFYFIRNALMISMALALVGYWLYPTAPPRLMPEWGFTDSISQFLGLGNLHFDNGPAKSFLNLYAAVPSMHVCMAILIGWPMARLVSTRPARVLWALYPAFVTFVVVATGNHYLTDVFLGGLTAGISFFLAKRLLARARPEKWAFGHATA